MIGNIVLSLAGRDADRLFIIISAADENYVLISDGDCHKIEKPKKKKLKHLKTVEERSDIAELIRNGLTNKQIKRILNTARANKGEE